MLLFWLGLSSLLRLVRIGNLIIIGLSFLLLAFQLEGYMAGWPLWQMWLSVACTAAAGYAVNDIRDLAIDGINRPDRPLPSGRLSVRSAWWAYAGLNALALALALGYGPKLAAVVAVAQVLLWVYAFWLKCWPLVGNVLVAALSAASLAVLQLHFAHSQPLIWLMAGFAFGVSLIRELVKDVEDLQGDAQHRCKTLPIYIGVGPTKILLLLLTACYSASIVYFSWKLSFFFAVLIGAATAGLAVGIALSRTAAHYKRLSLACKLLMLLGIAAMPLLGRA